MAIVAQRSRWLPTMRAAGGHRAGVAREKRQEGAARKAHRAHRAVKQERRSRQVARLLHQQDEEEEDQDLRQEHHHAAHAADDGVDEQVLHEPVGQVLGAQLSEHVEALLDPLHRIGGPGEHRLEDEEEDDHQDRHAEPRIEHDAVDAVGEFVGEDLVKPELAQDPVEARKVVLLGRLGHPGRPGGRVGEKLGEPVDALLAHGDRLDHGHAELAREVLGLELDPAAAREVHHVDRHHGGELQALRGHDELEAAPQVRRVKHADDEIGPALAARDALEDVDRHLLVGRARMKGIGARKVEHADLLGRADELALDALDGHARIVGDLLLRTRQNVEERRLAGVRIAEHRDERPGRIDVNGGDGHQSRLLTSMQRASTNLSANVETPMRTAIGSPPRAAFCNTTHGSPAVKPISSSQISQSSGAPSAWTPTTSSSSPMAALSRVNVSNIFIYGGLILRASGRLRGSEARVQPRG